jgi:type III secretory pathway component EscS
VYSVLYNNLGAIVTVLAIVGALVGIFQALLALEKRPSQRTSG